MIPPEGKRIRTRWARLAAVPAIGLLGALLFAEALLLDVEPARPRPAPPASSAPPPSRLPPTAPPPPDRPARDPALDLPPLAAAWREAILQNRRDQVVELAGTLRAAPDGRAQLLLLSKDANPRVRAYSITELARRRDPSLREVFELAKSDTSPFVRESARYGLHLLE